MTSDTSRTAAMTRLANRLFPAAEGFPPASAAIDVDRAIEALLSAWPDARGDVMDALNRIANDGVDDPEALRSGVPDGWRALTLGVATAYYNSRAVREALAYDGPSRRPLDDAETTVPGGLEDVIARGPIWRPAGDETCPAKDST